MTWDAKHFSSLNDNPQNMFQKFNEKKFRCDLNTSPIKLNEKRLASFILSLAIDKKMFLLFTERALQLPVSRFLFFAKPIKIPETIFRPKMKKQDLILQEIHFETTLLIVDIMLMQIFMSFYSKSKANRC